MATSSGYHHCINLGIDLWLAVPRQCLHVSIVMAVARHTATYVARQFVGTRLRTVAVLANCVNPLVGV
jgi:hypothetical protein